MLRGSMSCAAQHRQRWRRRGVQRRWRRCAVQRRRRPRRCAQFLPPRGGAVDQRYARALPREPFPARAPCHSAETLWQGATWQPPAARAAARSTFAAIPFMFLSYPCCNRLQVNPRPPLVAAAGTAVAAAAAAPATAGAAIATIIADTIRCRRSRLRRHRCRHSHHRRHCCRLCRLRLSRSHRHRQRSPPLPSPPLPCSSATMFATGQPLLLLLLLPLLPPPQPPSPSIASPPPPIAPLPQPSPPPSLPPLPSPPWSLTPPSPCSLPLPSPPPPDPPDQLPPQQQPPFHHVGAPSTQPRLQRTFGHLYRPDLAYRPHCPP